MLANPSTAKQAGSLDPNRVRTGLTLTLSKCTSQSGVSERWLRFQLRFHNHLDQVALAVDVELVILYIRAREGLRSLV